MTRLMPNQSRREGEKIMVHAPEAEQPRSGRIEAPSVAGPEAPDQKLEVKVTLSREDRREIVAEIKAEVLSAIAFARQLKDDSYASEKIAAETMRSIKPLLQSLEGRVEP